MVKADAGHSGTFVRLAGSNAAVWHAAIELGEENLLVQKWIAGHIVDTSAIFRYGRPIHWTYCEELRRLGRFGPSAVRRYHPTSKYRSEHLPILRRLGVVLGLHGFANITAVSAADGSGVKIFEVDARPNAWASQGNRVGDDPVERIRHWFATGDSLAGHSTTGQTRHSDNASYFRRTRRRALILNRNGPFRGFQTTNPDAWLLAGWTLLRGPG